MGACRGIDKEEDGKQRWGKVCEIGRGGLARYREERRHVGDRQRINKLKDILLGAKSRDDPRVTSSLWSGHHYSYHDFRQVSLAWEQGDMEAFIIYSISFGTALLFSALALVH